MDTGRSLKKNITFSCIVGIFIISFLALLLNKFTLNNNSIASELQSQSPTVVFMDSNSGMKIPALVAPQILVSEFQIFPENGTENINPAGIFPKINLNDGLIKYVSLTSSKGKEIEGTISSSGNTWEATQILDMSDSYTIKIEGKDFLGRSVKKVSSFTTLDPPGGINGMAIYPLDGMKMGAGQPISIGFKYPIKDRSMVEKAIKISNTSGQIGTFHWLNDTTVRYRAENFWNPGSKITVDVDLFGVDMGDGIYGPNPRKVTFDISNKTKIATVDDNEKILIVKENNEIIKTIPVSLGMDRFPTPNGVHIVAETHRTLLMDSTTWGLSENDPNSYKTEVEYATRLSNGGVFAHAAPWAASSLGKENVSHGCLNMTVEDAAWFSSNMIPGDIVIISNTKGSILPFGDGFGGDWNVPWNTWSA